MSGSITVRSKMRYDKSIKNSLSGSRGEQLVRCAKRLSINAQPSINKNSCDYDSCHHAPKAGRRLLHLRG